MPSAYVLINCKLGLEQRVIYELKLLREVVEAERISSIYDIVVKVKADTPEELKKTINWRIRTIQGIRSTLTFFAIQQRHGGNAADNTLLENGEELSMDNKNKSAAAGAS
jgi:DNA-binding Lrp family transcriptional regulator